MCDDVKAEGDQMGKKGIECSPITDEGWGTSSPRSAGPAAAI